MLQSPRMISYRVPNLAQARDWYARVLGQGPAFDSPMACIFAIGDVSLALLPAEDRPDGLAGGVAFWAVDDIDAAYRRLVAEGAAPVTEITLLMMKSRIARLRDPFGNVIGLIGGSEKKASLDDRPSDSALTVAFCRALSTYEPREEIRGQDTLAALFVAEESQKTLADPSARAWMIQKFGGTYEFFVARTAYGDGLFREALRQDLPQIVVLGAGYDTRGLRFRDEIRGTRIFELDSALTQERKRRLLAAAGVSEPPQLRYLPVNFERQKLSDVLAAAGYEKDRKTLFVWEGVSYYLTAAAVDATFAFLRERAAPGSRLCFDYMVKAPTWRAGTASRSSSRRGAGPTPPSPCSSGSKRDGSAPSSPSAGCA